MEKNKQVFTEEDDEVGEPEYPKEMTNDFMMMLSQITFKNISYQSYSSHK